MGCDAHLLFYCPSTQRWRAKYEQRLDRAVIHLAQMAHPGRDVEGLEPMTMGETLYLVMGRRPPHLPDAPNNRTTILGLPRDDSAAGRTRRELEHAMSTLVEISSSYISELERGCAELELEEQ